MKLLRHPAFYLVLVWMLFLASVAYVAPRLPERVASHFDFHGQPNGWMSRPAYVAWTLGTGFGVPLFIVGCCWATQFLPRWLVRMPHKDYWLAPERRAATGRWLARYALWLAVAMVLFNTGMDLTTLQANGLPSPHLLNWGIYACVGFMLAAIAVWCVGFYRRFGQPGQGEAA